VAELVAHRYSRSLVIQAERVLPRLFAWLLKRHVRDVRAVNEEHLSRLPARAGREQDRFAALLLPPLPCSAYTNIVRRFFAFLDKRGLILRNPAQDLPARHVEQLPPKVLSEAEARGPRERASTAAHSSACATRRSSRSSTARPYGFQSA